MAETDFSGKDQGSAMIDKIPDLWFDWYGRLLPGAIIISLLLFHHDIAIDKVKENIWIIIGGAYLLGHLIQPFSSGLLQKMDKDLAGRKSKGLSKLYSELVGFFSCLLATIVIIIIEIVNDYQTASLKDTFKNQWTLFLYVLIFALATFVRKKAFNRKKKRDDDAAKKAVEETAEVESKPAEIIQFILPPSFNEELSNKIKESVKNMLINEMPEILKQSADKK